MSDQPTTARLLSQTLDTRRGVNKLFDAVINCDHGLPVDEIHWALSVIADMFDIPIHQETTTATLAPGLSPAARRISDVISERDDQPEPTPYRLCKDTLDKPAIEALLKDLGLPFVRVDLVRCPQAAASPAPEKHEPSEDLREFVAVFTEHVRSTDAAVCANLAERGWSPERIEEAWEEFAAHGPSVEDIADEMLAADDAAAAIADAAEPTAETIDETPAETADLNDLSAACPEPTAD